MRNTYVIGNFTVGQVETKGEKSELNDLFKNAAKKKRWKVPTNLNNYDDQSVCWATYHKHSIVGGCQLTHNGPKGLPFEQAWPDFENLKTQRCGEIVNFGFENCPGETSLSFLIPCIEMIRYCEQNNIDSLFTAITERRRRQYTSLGCPFEIVGPLREHWGYPSHLLTVSIMAIRNNVAQRLNRRPWARIQWDRNA